MHFFIMIAYTKYKKEMTSLSLKKKIVSLVLALVLLVPMGLSVAPQSAQAADVNVVVNGQALQSDQSAVIYNGRTMVPLRPIFEALGCDVEWINEYNSITGYDPQTNIVMGLIVDQPTLFAADFNEWSRYEQNPTSQATKNFMRENTKTIDVPPMLLSGRTMVPTRVISEAIGCSVEWDNATRTVYINR